MMFPLSLGDSIRAFLDEYGDENLESFEIFKNRSHSRFEEFDRIERDTHCREVGTEKFGGFIVAKFELKEK